MAGIYLEGVRKVFGEVVALDGISLEVRDGEFAVLLGPSGCGKTTLLRCVAGLERVEEGRVFIGGRDVTDLPPRRRKVAMVFQNYAIFPHLTAFDNIAFGLRLKGLKGTDLERRVRSAAELLRIEGLLDRYPSQLSGGQCQRVAVARAIAVHPEVLLMDEPLSNLDALLRLQMRAELKRLFREIGTTTLYVTHDQVEALSLGDRIAVMDQGRVLQYDTPLEIYENPANTFVGGFIGNPPMNFLPCRVAELGKGTSLQTEGGTLPLSQQLSALLEGRREVLLGIRAENIEASRDPGPDRLRGKVMVTEPLGSHNLITVEIGKTPLKVIAPPGSLHREGEDIWLRIHPEKVRLFDPETGENLHEG